jgi:sister chromatid cohesion protein DCC1
MAQIVQASDMEFSKALRDQYILELGGIYSSPVLSRTHRLTGYLRPLPVVPLSNILIYIFTSLISHGLPRKQIPASRLMEVLQVEHEVPSAVTMQVMQWFGSVSGDRWEMNDTQSVRQVGLGLLRPHMVSTSCNLRYCFLFVDSMNP